MLKELTKSIGVILLSAGVSCLSAWCVVPEDKTDVVPANEWLGAAIQAIGGELHPGATATHASACVVFKEGASTIKIRDVALTAAFNVLRAKGKLADDSDSDSGQYIYGDDDYDKF